MDIADDNSDGPPYPPGGGGGNSNYHNIKDNDILSLNDISRIIRENLSSNIVISQEAEEFIQKLTLEFIGLITSEAERICAETENRKIGGDILRSWSTLRLRDYIRNGSGEGSESQNILIPNHNPVESLERSFSQAGGENSSS